MEHSTRRDGRPVEEVGYYNTITKQSYFDVPKINKWLERGVKPTRTVANLLNKNLNTQGFDGQNSELKLVTILYDQKQLIDF